MKREEQSTAVASKVVLGLFSLPLLTSLLVVTLGSLKMLGETYKESLPIGLVLTFTGIPLMILFAGSSVGYYSIVYLWVRENDNKWEYWAKTILFATVLTILVWLVYVAGGAIFLWLANWLIH